MVVGRLITEAGIALEVYRLQADGHWLLLATREDDDPVSQPPFDAIAFPLATLWA